MNRAEDQRHSVQQAHTGPALSHAVWCVVSIHRAWLFFPFVYLWIFVGFVVVVAVVHLFISEAESHLD